MAKSSVPLEPLLGGLRAGRVRPLRIQAPGKLEWLLSLSLISASVSVIDCGILLGAAAVAERLYLGPRYAFPETQQQLYYGLALFAALLQLNIFHLTGLYRFKRLANFTYQIRHILWAVGMLFLSLLAVLYLTKLSATYSRGWMILWSALTVGGLCAARVVLCPTAQRLMKEGQLARRIAVVGGGKMAERLVAYLRDFHSARLRFVGMFDDRRNTRDADAAILPDGTVDDLCRRARNEQIDAIIVAMPAVSAERLAGVLKRLKSLPVDIRLCTDSLEYCLPQSSYEFCGVVPLLRLYDKPVSGWGLLVKAVEDKVLSIILLLALSPLMLTIAALIKIDSPGPVFFKQSRYGFNNRLITVWKYRTMYQDQTDFNAERLTTKDDPRVTRVGRVLRRYSLDELPQFINVLLGDMSIVGPRPHAVSAKAAGELYEAVVEEYAARHRMKPGVTGWAQINGWRGDTETIEKIRQRVAFDLYYIDNWSILLDLKIVLMTAYVMLKDENAY